MPRPITKTDLIGLANDQFDKMFKLINSVSMESQNKTFDFEDRDKNIRDVLVHLYEWHQLFINWANENIKGNSKPFLLEPYTWKTYPQMNIDLWKKHQQTSYSDAVKLLKGSHTKIMAIIEKFTNDELFIKRHFIWTGTTNLGSYCISTTSSHYDWAIKKIKRHIQSLS